MLSKLIDHTSATLTCHTDREQVRHPLTLVIWEDFLHTTAGPGEEEVGLVIQLCSICSRAEKQQGEQEFQRLSPCSIVCFNSEIATVISFSVVFTPVMIWIN